MQTKAMLEQIESAGRDIRAALHRGDMNQAKLLISRKIGWMICAGQIAVKLKAPKYG